jgi:hypothetical protein
MVAKKKGLWSMKRGRTAIEEKSEMFDGRESGQFSVKSGIASFCCGNLFWEKGNWFKEPFVFCWRTALTWELKASVAREREAGDQDVSKGTAVAKEDLAF